MGGGVGIAVIADIARDRRSKTLNHKGREETQRKTSEVCAKLGSLGTTRYKSFGILVERWGEGRAKIAVIARHRRNRVIGRAKTLPLIHTDDTDRRNQERFTVKGAEDAKKSTGWVGQTHADLG